MAEDKKDQPQSISFDFKTVSARRSSVVAASRPAQGGLDTAEEKRCEEIAQQVNEEQWRPWSNLMRKCRGEYDFKFCFPLPVPPIQPLIGMVWGDSQCDCIEGDDTEIVQIIVCNRYSNLVMAHFTINRVVVVQANGQAVPNLPDGSPSIQLVPIGPYCFGDIAPCTCVARQFVLRLRGAPAGSYQIRLEGICFEACFHQFQQDCFQFEVCKD